MPELRLGDRAGLPLLPVVRRASALKLVEFFLAHPLLDGERGKALRVSRYFEDPDIGPHVRFSVWDESGKVEAAVSLNEEEAGPARSLRRALVP